MASGSSLLTSSVPTAIAPASVTIGHVQLRDLIVCPRKRNIVNYVQDSSIIEQDIRLPELPPRTLAELSFSPNTIASLVVPDTGHTLLAAGGPEAEIHLSLQSPQPSFNHEHVRSNQGAIWQFETTISGSINNSVFLTSMSLTNSHQSSAEPRIVVSNNDCTVRFYDIPIRGQQRPKAIKPAGTLQLDVAVNHTSLSPDGCTLLSVGDSAKVHLHRVTGGSRITFTPITTLTLPPPCSISSTFPYTCSPASFSTAFSANGSKFAVASQEGAVVVWDVRSSRPLKMFYTDKTRTCGSKMDNDRPTGNGNAHGWLNEEFWDWSQGGSKAPGWGVRNVKFGSGGERGFSGREIMTFTEHTSLIHVIDARTFETEEIITMPKYFGQTRRPPLRARRPRSPRHAPPSDRPQIQRPTPPPVVLALQETFRISASGSFPFSSSSSRTTDPQPRRSGHIRHDRGTDAEDDLVVIPPLGDRAVENDVQRLFEAHGLRTPHRDERGEEDGEANNNVSGGRGDDEMEVDELESDCVPSRSPSRPSTPSPLSHIPAQASTSRFLPPIPPPNVGPYPVRLPSPLARWRAFAQDDFRALRPRGAHNTAIDLDADMDVDADANASGSSGVDLAGVCFDPTGGYLYVASTDGVAEWSVKGAEKRWWADTAWA